MEANERSVFLNELLGSFQARPQRVAVAALVGPPDMVNEIKT
jgi:hypothetical protein